MDFRILGPLEACHDGHEVALDISRLHKALPADVLMTRPPGNLLRVGPDELDLHRFERLMEEGRRLIAGATTSKALTDSRNGV